MNITLKRTTFTNKTTIGELTFDNQKYYTLEDVDRKLTSTMKLEDIKKIKVKSETCIPYGTYQIVWSFSNRFQKFMPELVNVPGFEGIRMHVGNYANYTEYLKNIPKTKEVTLKEPIFIDVYE